MITTIIPIEPIEAAIREEMDSLCGRKGWTAPIDKSIPFREYGMAKIAVEYYTGAELRIVGQPNKGTIHVHSDGYREDQIQLRQIDLDAMRILAEAA